MAVTSGFFNSINHDRRYDAIQMGQMFDGIIRDGVLQSFGGAMMVETNQGMIVSVRVGRAWFNHTWVYNDALLPIDLGLSELILDRIDAIVVDINQQDEVRKGNIILLRGEPSSNPQKPALINNGVDHFQYPLAYIRVRQESTTINQADIENRVGTSECPFVTAPLDKVSIDDLLAQWSDDFKIWTENQKNDFNGWKEEHKNAFNAWFATIQDIMTTHVAGNLQMQMNKILRIRAATIPAENWIGSGPWYQDISILGLEEGDSPFIQCTNGAANKTEKKAIQKQWNFIDSAEVFDNVLRVHAAFEKPTITFSIVVKGR